MDKVKIFIASFLITLTVAACAPAPVKAPSPSSEPIEENKDTIAEVQDLLNKKGYKAGPADGIAGPKTRGAIKKFEEDNNFPIDGLLDEAVYLALKPGSEEQVSGAAGPSKSNLAWPTFFQKPASNSTPAEQKLRAESSPFNRSGVQACLVTGGGMGVLTYMWKKDAKLAMAAALAGCGVGIGANHYLQERRKQYADDEQRLNQMIADVKADNERLTRVIQSAEEVIGEDKKRMDEIDQAYKQKQISIDDAQQEMQAVDDNRAFLEQTLANLKKREAEWIKVADSEREKQSPTDMAAMDREINELQSQIASLESDLEILVNRRGVSPIG